MYLIFTIVLSGSSPASAVSDQCLSLGAGAFLTLSLVANVCQTAVSSYYSSHPQEIADDYNTTDTGQIRTPSIVAGVFSAIASSTLVTAGITGALNGWKSYPKFHLSAVLLSLIMSFSALDAVMVSAKEGAQMGLSSYATRLQLSSASLGLLLNSILLCWFLPIVCAPPNSETGEIPPTVPNPLERAV